jgi:hypothetical protein
MFAGEDMNDLLYSYPEDGGSNASETLVPFNHERCLYHRTPINTTCTPGSHSLILYIFVHMYNQCDAAGDMYLAKTANHVAVFTG